MRLLVLLYKQPDLTTCLRLPLQPLPLLLHFSWGNGGGAGRASSDVRAVGLALEPLGTKDGLSIVDSGGVVVAIELLDGALVVGHDDG